MTVRKLVDLILKDAGYEVILAETGADGLRVARKQTPDLILLDYILPDLPSPEICRLLLEEPATARIPVVMISTNGGAIRQLYADSANVKDYLTKPFQGRVLQNAVEQVLGGGKGVAAEAAPATRTAPPQPGGATKSGHTQRLPPPDLSGAAGGAPVLRLRPRAPGQSEPATPPAGRRDDEENDESSAAAPSEPRAIPAPPPVVNPPPAPYAYSLEPPPAPPAPSANQVLAAAGRGPDPHATLRAILNERFRGIGRMIPELERRRGDLPPESYYLPYLLRQELLTEVVAEAERVQFAADRGPLLAGTSESLGIDAALAYLGRARATGVFSLRLPRETIDVRLAEGRVVAVHANNPRLYCAGAAYHFRALPTAVIAAAVAAQQRDGTPFFLTVHRLGQLSEVEALRALLRAQGAKAVLRAFVTPGVRYAFMARELSPEARRFSLDQSVRGFVFDVLRGVDDWLEIETKVGPGDTVFGLAPEAEGVLPELGLTVTEQGLLARFDGRASVEQIAQATGVGLYEVGALVYRLARLNLVRAITHPGAAPGEADVEAFLEAAEPRSTAPSAAAHKPDEDRPEAG